MARKNLLTYRGWPNLNIRTKSTNGINENTFIRDKKNDEIKNEIIIKMRICMAVHMIKIIPKDWPTSASNISINAD